MSARPVPAYAAKLALARRKGYTLRKPVVSVALHWRERPGIGYGVVVPDDQDPAALDWSWVRNLEVIVLHETEPVSRLTSALGAIEAAHPRRLLVLEMVDPKIVSIIDASDEAARVAA